MTLCARLFPSHAPIAHRAVARLVALGWTEGQIATYLRKAAREPGLSNDRTRHPLLTAVWLAEKQFREAPRDPPAQSSPRGAQKPEPPVSKEITEAFVEKHRKLLATLEQAFTRKLVGRGVVEKQRAWVAKLEARISMQKPK